MHLSIATDLEIPSKSAPIGSTSLVPAYTEVPKPILARLPLGYSDEDGEDGYESEPSDGEPTTPSGSGGFGHIALQPQGYLVCRARRQVLYTRARLPDLGADETSATHALWEALHAFRPTVRPAQVAAGFWDSLSGAQGESTLAHLRRCFNWAELDLPLEAEGAWYGVAFRSARTRTPPPKGSWLDVSAATVTAQLYAADRAAHEEAVQAGGLLLYWYAVPTEQGENLATCIWTSREAARAAARLPAHRHAAAVAAQAFEAFAITRYAVRKRRGQTAVEIEAWTEEAGRAEDQMAGQRGERRSRASAPRPGL